MDFLIYLFMGFAFGASYPVPLPSTSGNVMVSNGSKWTSTSGTLAVGRIPAFDTLTPSQSGNSGKFLTTNGSASSWGSPTIVPVVASKSANYTVAGTDDFLIATAGLTFTLPAASTSKAFTFVNTSSTTTGTIARAGSDLFYPSGTAGTTAILLPNQYDSITIQSDASASWHITSYNRPPKITRYTSGSGTHAITAGTRYIIFKMVGGGGGGSGSGSASAGNGGNGGDTTFGASTAAGGTGGSFVGAGPAGGAATLGSGHEGIAVSGGSGSGFQGGDLTLKLAGLPGGNSALGGGGGAGYYNTAGLAGGTNSGGGGGSGGNGGALNSISGTSGAAGAYIEARIASPLYSYAYGVGASGSAGSAGTSGFVGGAGAAGQLVVEEHFQ